MSVQIQTITRTRGDTYPFTVTFRDSAGALVDLTGASFILTVNEEEDPDADELPEFSLVGVVAAPLTGVVEFTLSESDADHVGRFFYDIQMTDVQGYIRTMMRGTFEMQQDITKNEYLWTAGGKTAIDGSDGIYLVMQHANDTWEYTVRDSVPVLKVSFSDIDSHISRYVRPTDWSAIDWDRRFELSGLVYMDLSWWSQWTCSNSYANLGYMAGGLDNDVWANDCWVWAVMPDPVTQIPSQSNYDYSAAKSWVAGWIQFVISWDAETGELSMRAWQPPGESDPVSSDASITAIVPFRFSDFAFGMAAETVGAAEIAWLKYEVLP